MKEIPLSLCEKSALIENLKANIRYDARDFMEIRPIKINFGKDYGCCTVTLGETRVLAQVTCEVVEPRPSRPSEGKLSIGVHLSPMAAAHFEQGRGNELIDEIQQILDRNIKESRCVDVESLCILAEENVWQFKVDVTVLNHAGNLGDACNLAAVSALRHFHRPDVTVEEDGRVTIHTHEERELIPTFLKKIPVCLTYALFVVENQCITILDPTEKEERVMSGKMVVGLNPHGEITSLLFPGKMCLKKHQIMSNISKAFNKAKSIAETVLSLVEEDLEKRKTENKTDGFLNCLKSDSQYIKERLLDRVKSFQTRQSEPATVKIELGDEEANDASVSNVSNAASNDPSVNKDVEMDESDEEFTPESLRMTLPEIRASKATSKADVHMREHVGDEEEACTMKLDADNI